MFIIDTETKKSVKIEKVTFKEMGLKEKSDLQEWIVNEPSILGEDLLIIQKEFDGFSDTYERLDLLALDLKGNLVIIENKLDDSGKEVTWQAMKYASYCSTLSKDGIRSIFQGYLNKYANGAGAEDKICEFLNKPDFEEVMLNQDLTQRIILVAGEFRKEVTSAVLWARKFRMQIQCIKMIPYIIDGKLILDIDQIIPVKDTTDIMISLDVKAHEEISTGEEIAEREKIRNSFWKILLEEMNKKSDLYKGISTTANHYDHWISAGSGVSGVSYDFVITKKYVSVELAISKSGKEDNKKIYDILYAQKDKIEKETMQNITWQRLDEKIMSRISVRLENINIFNNDDWDKIKEFLINSMFTFSSVIKSYLQNIKLSK